MAENNLGNLYYTLNIDLDKDVVSKLEKQLSNINLVNNTIGKDLSKSVVGDFSKAGEMVEKTIADIKAKIKALESYKVTLAIGETGAVQLQINELKNTLKLIEKPVEITLKLSDITEMSENTLGDIQAKIKALQSYKSTIDIVDAEQIHNVQQMVEKLKGVTSETINNNQGLDQQKQTYDEIVALIRQSTGASSEKAGAIAKEQMALDELKNQRSQIAAAEKAGAISTEDSIRLKGQIIEKETQHKAALAGLNSELRNEVKTNMAAAGSMDELSQKVAKLKVEYRGLSEEARAGSVGKTMLKDIQTMDSKIKTLDASIGNYSRNVGDYASGMYGLSYSIQQVGRELPNIAISPQMFIMAISNNLPILQDELTRATRKYKELIEQHKIGLNLDQKAVPVGAQIVKSLISWQTALIALITIMTVFGKQIFNFIGDAWNAAKGVDALKVASKQLTEALNEVNKSVRKEITELKLLTLVSLDKARSDKERGAATDQILKQYPELLKNYTREQLLTDETASAFKRLREEILEAARAKVAMDGIIKNYEEIARQEKILKEGGTFMGDFIRTIPGLQNFVGDAVAASNKIKGLKAANDEFLESFNVKVEDPFGIAAASREFEIYSKLQSDETKRIYDERSGFISEDTKTYEAWLERQLILYKDNIDAKIQLEQALATIRAGKKNNSSSPVSTPKFVDTEKQERERQRDIRDMEYSTAQARIDAMQEGQDRVLEQLDLNHRREMDMLDRQREDQIQKIKDNARAIFNADPKNKGKVFDGKGIGLQDEEEAGFNLNRNAILEKQRVETELAENKMFMSILSKYKDYATKRLEIEKNLNEDIKILESKRTEDNSGQIDNAIAQRTKEADEDFSSSLMDEFKESDDWIKMFEDLDRMSNETINSLLAKFEEFKASAGKNLAPTELKELTRAIEKLRATSEQRNPFVAIANGFKKLRDSIKKGDKDGIKDALKTIEDGSTEAFDRIEELTEILGELPAEIIAAAKEVTGGISSMIDGITTLTKSSSAAMAATSAAASESMSAVEKASVILAIVAAAMQITMAIVGLFKGKSKAERDTEKLQAISQKIEGTYEAINKQLERRVALIKEATAAESVHLDTISQAEIEAQKEFVKSQFESTTGASGILGKFTSGMEIFGKAGKNNDLGIKEVMKMMGLDSFEDFVEWWNSGGYKDFIMQGYTVTNQDQWESMVDTWNDLTKAAEESAKATSEAITGISFDSFKDSLDNLITDVDTAFGDIADSFEDHMSDAVLNFVKREYLNGALKEWYDEFELKAKDGEITKDEAEALREMYHDIYEEGSRRYDEAMDVIGANDASQDSALSQAIKGIQESNPGLIEAYLNTIRETNIAMKIGSENMLSVMQNSQHIQSQSLSELQAINSNTLAMVTAFKSVMAASKQDTGGSALRVTVI